MLPSKSIEAFFSLEMPVQITAPIAASESDAAWIAIFSKDLERTKAVKLFESLKPGLLPGAPRLFDAKRDRVENGGLRAVSFSLEVAFRRQKANR
ncbi:MAG: hypothetical protein ACREQ7_18105 [Candidatus Binatia bacterium]